jgi:peptide/nickel transport system ATP-binding protein
VEIGPAEQMLVDPSHPYTQKLLASIPRLHSKERPGFIPGAPPDLRNPPPGCRFHPRCPHALDICKREAPPAMSLEPGRRVNCWLLEPDA